MAIRIIEYLTCVFPAAATSRNFKRLKQDGLCLYHDLLICQLQYMHKYKGMRQT
jgi:hypothetical protein